MALHPEPRIFLERRESTEEGQPVFDMASCRRCGQEYLVGGVRDEKKLTHSFAEGEAPRQKRYFMLWRQEPEPESDEDQEVAVPEELTQKGTLWSLCPGCGAIWRDEPTCECGTSAPRPVPLLEVATKDGVLNQCHSCGLRSVNIVREFVFQQDAPAAVLATALYQHISKSTTDLKKRKVLSFSDSRQDAAFFAPYLEYTYMRFLYRRLVMMCLEQNRPLDDYRLGSLCDDVVRMAERQGIFDPGLDRKERRKEVWKWILQDFWGTWDRRNSLEGVGLLCFAPMFPEGWQPIKELLEPPWNLSPAEARGVYHVLLNTLRFVNATTCPEDGPEPDDPFFEPRNREYRFRGETSDSRKRIYSLIPAPGRSNSRSAFLMKLLGTLAGKADESQMREVLGKIWADLRNNWAGSAMPGSPEGKEGMLYRLDHRYWQIIEEPTDSPWFACEQCGAMSPVSVRGVCPTFGCEGRLRPIGPDERNEMRLNHYRHLYASLVPAPMVCREHTAQLVTEHASNVQQGFISGKVNVLSCSTTFELGVDLGELESVFLKNVPPEPANYVQRAGRAGRRVGAAGFILTFAQLRSHDMAYFRDPRRMLEGRIKPPAFEIENEKIVRRHLHSVVLANFFRQAQFRDYFGNVESFFRLAGAGPSGTDNLRDYLATRPGALMTSLSRVLPANIAGLFDVSQWGWVSGLLGSDGTLTVADEKIRDEYGRLQDFHAAKSTEWNSSSDQATKNRINADMDWADRRMKTVKGRRLIDFLATQTVIPKYGFPVDVVELATLNSAPAAKEVQLERDLRIGVSEFAPGGKVVANGYVWESAGLRVVRNRAWPVYVYATCPQCKQFCMKALKSATDRERLACDAHGAIPQSQVHKFIDPLFGFVTRRNERPGKTGESRPRRDYTTRPYFFGYAAPQEKRVSIGGRQVVCKYSSDGELAVICKGRRGAGFWVCLQCGAAYNEMPSNRRRERSHETPMGARCSHTINGPFHLGHTFKTDVLSVSLPGAAGDDSFWFSLLYAVLEGASIALGIRRPTWTDACTFPGLTWGSCSSTAFPAERGT